MSVVHTPLFGSNTPQRAIGAGFHNVGSGVLRAAHESVVKKIERHYGERCGHIPLNTASTRVLVEFPTTDIRTQMAYLSHLFGKEIAPMTFDELKAASADKPLVVPYVNVPETESLLHELGAQSWGIPSKMTHVLKNKASFYALADEFDMAGFRTPDYAVANIHDLTAEAYTFLGKIEDLYKSTGLAGAYPLGVMMRAAESDGNYGCCLVYESDGRIILVPNGEADHTEYYTDWHEALTISQQYLLSAIDPQKEPRIVISRYIDFVDSPGMSMVMMDGQVESLRWNGQLQKKGSKACVGTSTFIPKNAYVQRLQQQYEDRTAAFFEVFLKRVAKKCDIDFASIRGIANLDIMLPTELEQRLQHKRKQDPVNYLAECNPRWTNYTDAILTILGVSRREQTIYNMRSVIQEGICSIDKHSLPPDADPRFIRGCVFERDAVLQREGTRIICRMTKNPLGLIFAGDLQRAQEEFNAILAPLAVKTVS